MLGFNSFDPVDYFYDEEPFPGTLWDSWIEGCNPAIDAEFARINYWWLNDALGCFIEGTTRIFPERYKTLFAQDKNDQARILFVQEFSPFIREIIALTGNGKPLQPFTFESRTMDSPFLNEADYSSCQAAYSIWCMDWGMTGLLNGSAADAAIGFTYSQIALEIAHETRRAMLGKNPTFFSDSDYEKSVVSKLARKAALARIKHDPKQEAKRFIFSCWQVWQEEPERYKFKSDFAKDMLKQEQCKVLESQKKIEDWCREWKKTHPAG